MRTSLHIGTIGGIRIEVNFSWLIIFVLLIFTLATGWFPASVPGQSVVALWLAATVAVLLFFGSVLAHELAHSLVARSRGLPVKSITLFIFGGVSDIEREPQSAGVEFQMAFVGPLTSLLLGGVMLLVSLGLDVIGAPTLIVAVASYLGIVNLLLGVFNLIPGFPMDGGRVLRSIIWQATGSLSKATQWAVYVGQAVAYLMILVGVWLFFTGFVLDGLWIGFIGLFLLQAAQAENAQVQLEASLAGVTVGDLMSPPPATVTSNVSAQQFVDDYLLRTGQRALPVVDDVEDMRLIGIVTLRDVRRLAREQWAVTPVSQIMTPLTQLKTVEARQAVSDTLPIIREAGVNQLPVVRDGRLVGILDLEAIVRRLQVRRELGMERSAGAPRQDLRPPSEVERRPAGSTADTRPADDVSGRAGPATENRVYGPPGREARRRVWGYSRSLAGSVTVDTTQAVVIQRHVERPTDGWPLPCCGCDLLSRLTPPHEQDGTRHAFNVTPFGVRVVARSGKSLARVPEGASNGQAHSGDR